MTKLTAYLALPLSVTSPQLWSDHFLLVVGNFPTVALFPLTLAEEAFTG
jgi:hypothetical protein